MNHRKPRTIFAALVIVFGTVFGLLGLSQVSSSAASHRSAKASAAVSKTANTPAKSQFQVCNLAGDSGQNGLSRQIIQSDLTGWLYRTYSLTASSTPPGGCGPKVSLTPGTDMWVEQGTAVGVPYPNVNWSFSVSNGSVVNSGLESQYAAIEVAANSGTTVVTITNTSVGPPTTGTLELCKTAGDKYVSGNFNFTVSGVAGTQSVATGDCNDITVPAGNDTVTESARFPYAMTGASALPSTALVSSDNGTQTAVVNVPSGGSTTLFITNSTLTGYAKVCKTLYRTQDNVLAGQTFTFDVSASFNGAPVNVPSTVSIQAQSFGNTVCTFLSNNKGPIALPLGTTVTATEVVPSGASFQSVGTSISPSNLNAGSTASTAVFYVGNIPAPNNIGSGGKGTVTQATFTNEALGYVEVCKTSTNSVDPINQGTPFNFTIGGVGAIPAVPVGLCSLGYQLPVGTTTITETSPLSHLSTTWSDTQGETGTGTSATVTVPYNTENIVTFDNEINTGQLKICKNQTSSDAGLQNSTFDISYSYTLNGTVHTGTDMLKPSQCALPIVVPVLNSDLSQVQISVTEGTTSIPNVAVEPAAGGTQGITVVGPDTIVSQPTYPHPVSTPNGTPATIVLNSLEGITNVTFINGIDIPPAG